MTIEITLPDNNANKILNSFSALYTQMTGEVLSPKKSFAYIIGVYIDKVHSKNVLKAVEATRNTLKSAAEADMKNVTIIVTQDIVPPD